MLKKKNLKNVIAWPLGILAFIWLVSMLGMFLPDYVLRIPYALVPRQISGLPGIITSPLLHSGWPHLLSNSLPFLSLTGLIVFFYPRLWKRVLPTLWLGTGLFVWVAGRSFDYTSGHTISHIGASGVVYALAAFLAFSGIFRRDFRAVIVSLVVLFYYGGLVSGIVPGQEGISWESHLLGLVVGALAGWFYRGELEEHEVEKRKADAARRAPRQKTHFLAPDAFSKTKAERAQEKKENERLALWEKVERLKEEQRR
ncbi:MAG: membrane associated rhomboid family serine protease [Neolewinella sp.]|jgi:membrane associated rhomboid family serine protease